MTGLYCIMIGIDMISAICSGTARIEMAHGFADNWSIGCEAGICLNMMKDMNTTLEDIHRADLGSVGSGLTETGFRGTFQEIGIQLQYWPIFKFSGPFISTGLIHKDRSGPDCTLGLGYAIPIWKGFKSVISYRTGIMTAIRKGKMPPEDIRIGFNYTF